MSESRPVRKWWQILPQDAKTLNLATHPEIEAPLNEEGQPCPWPWEPQQLTNAPLGQYHCPYCGATVVAGIRHPDYRDLPEETPEDSPEETA